MSSTKINAGKYASLHIERIPNSPQSKDKSLRKEFIRYVHRLYRGCEQWVPWFDAEMIRLIDKTHPYFDHSDADFFLAKTERETVGRIAVLHNTLYNEKHNEESAHFYFFDCGNHPEVARALIERATDWAKQRGCKKLIGPMLFGGATGQGVLIDGFEYRAAMTMMNYNYPYYAQLLESVGFKKRKDYYSARLKPQEFQIPEKIRRAAEITIKRGRFEVVKFAKKKELESLSDTVGYLYNNILGSFNEAHRLTQREIENMTRDLVTISDPELVKVLRYDGKIVGFLLTFPDLSRAMQKGKGKLGLISMLRLKREFRKTRDLIINGLGILPEYQRLGGNALLYYELTETALAKGQRFRHADCTQIAETTEQMLNDLKKLGGEIYKIHRLYEKEI